MMVLAIDTALDACSVALVQGAGALNSQTLAAICEPMQRGHQERLAPAAAAAMAEAGVGFAALDRIAVTLGPGSFTGVRVGLAFAKGLSLALDITCIGLGTLEALALGTSGLAACALDARRGQLYFQLFRDGLPLTQPACAPVEEAARAVAAAAQDRPVLIGSGASALANLLGEAVVDPRTIVDCVALARRGASAPEPTGRPRPIYLRAPDARTLAERSLAERSLAERSLAERL